jgi:hypothetical protein
LNLSRELVKNLCLLELISFTWDFCKWTSLSLAQIYVHPELIWIGKFSFWPSPLRIEGADSIALRGISRDISQCEGNLFWKGFRWCRRGSERKSSNQDQFVWDKWSAILYHKSLRLCIFLSLHKKGVFYHSRKESSISRA